MDKQPEEILVFEVKVVDEIPPPNFNPPLTGSEELVLV